MRTWSRGGRGIPVRRALRSSLRRQAYHYRHRRQFLVEADGREGAAVLASLGRQVARVSPQEVVRQTTRDIPRELRNGSAQLLYVAVPLRRDLVEAAVPRFMDITAEWAKVAKASDGGS